MKLRDIILAAIQNSDLDCCAWLESVQMELADEIARALEKWSEDE